jgi:hypothetical protein
VRRAVLGMVLWSVITGVIGLLPTSGFSNLLTQPGPAPAPAPKLTALQLQLMLQRAPASNGVPHDHRCDPGQYGWDYICSYRTAVAAGSPRLKIGVLVDATTIVQATSPYPMAGPLSSPAQAKSSR